MYTRVASWATFATPLPMWGAGGSGMDLLPNMVTDFRDMIRAITATLGMSSYQASISVMLVRIDGLCIIADRADSL